MLVLSYENEFNLHAKEISFSYERMCTKTCFEEEAKGNSEMAYYGEAQMNTINRYKAATVNYLTIAVCEI